MNSDSIFYIGKTHKVCQDYACSFELESTSKYQDNIIAGVVSDGCSSSEDSDIGSRLLCKAATREFKRSKDVGLDYSSIVFSAERIAKMIPNTSERCLDATLLLAYTAGHLCKATICGDGVIARLRKDKYIDVTSVEFKSGAPLYLSYMCMPHGWAERYKSIFEYEKIITRYTIKTNGDVVDKVVTSQTTLNEGNYDDEDPFLVKEAYAIEDTECVAVMTDGVSSFMKTKKEDTSIVMETIPADEIIRQVMAFKSYTGQFVQRRVGKLRKEFDKVNWANTDDFSVAAVYLGD